MRNQLLLSICFEWLCVCSFGSTYVLYVRRALGYLSPLQMYPIDVSVDKHFNFDGLILNSEWGIFDLLTLSGIEATRTHFVVNIVKM